MERIRPGKKIHESDLNEASQIDVFLDIAGHMRNLKVDRPMGVRDYVDTNNSLARRLLDSTEQPCILHGDLHHFNILRSRDRWILIDPKGLWGDPAFEAAAFIKNPFGWIGNQPRLAALLEHRIERMASGLDVDPARVWGWSLVGVSSSERSGDEECAKVATALRSLDQFQLR